MLSLALNKYSAQKQKTKVLRRLLASRRFLLLADVQKQLEANPYQLFCASEERQFYNLLGIKIRLMLA